MSQFKPVPGRIPGTLLNLGGVDLVMPPLNLDGVRQFEGQIATLGQKPSLKENIEESLPVIHAALVRNYPDLTQDDLADLIDVGNYRQVCEALWVSSGYVAKGEEAPAPQ